jgi:hypothetical protein
MRDKRRGAGNAVVDVGVVGAVGSVFGLTGSALDAARGLLVMTKHKLNVFCRAHAPEETRPDNGEEHAVERSIQAEALANPSATWHCLA